jgi:cytoskeletal protein RodZ
MRSIEKKKKLSLLLLAAFVLAMALPAGAASAITEEGAASDVIVLLDVSQSVLPYFHEITDYVVSSVVKDFLRIGDSFHLLSFGEVTQVEINQKISGEEDARSILARLYLLYPLARNTDLIAACDYLYQYLADLPQSRGKVVVIITDGVQNPSEKSANFGLDAATVKTQLEAIAARIRSNGWPVYIIKVPFSAERAAAESRTAAGAASTGAASTDAAAAQANATDATNALAAALNSTVTEYSTEDKDSVARTSLSLPVAEFPQDLGKKGLSFSFPLVVRNTGDSEINLELQHILTDGSDILQKKSFLSLSPGKSGTMEVHVALSPDTPSGPTKLPIELYFADGLRVSPSHATLSFTLAPSPFAKLFRSGSTVILFVLVFLVGLGIVLAAVILIARKAPRRAAAPVVAAVRESADEAREREEARKRGAAAARTTGAASATAGATAAAAAATPGQKTAATVQAAAAPIQASPVAAAKAGGKTRLQPEAAAPGKSATGLPASAGASPTPALSAAASSGQETAPAPILATKPVHSKEAVREAREKEREERKHAAAVSSQTDALRIVRPGSIDLELRVEGQNPSIGRRNVHTLHAGSSASVGGGRSEFLVFLVPVPGRAAEIRYDGEHCSFVPLRTELFPGISGTMEDCLGKDIVMVSKSGYRMVLRFMKYEAPANRINRLLHCIETPGLFSTGES